MSKIIAKHLGFALLSGVLALGAASLAGAAEDAAGVVKYIGLSRDAAQAALDAAKAGNKEQAAASLKQARQYTKEITGDAAGMKLQKINQAVKAAGGAVEQGDLAEAAALLEVAVKSLDDLKAASKK